jgi:formate-dependent phosphoribosylglycinamide formyltransferase (GAR transformylase)
MMLELHRVVSVMAEVFVTFAAKVRLLTVKSNVTKELIFNDWIPHQVRDDTSITSVVPQSL